MPQYTVRDVPQEVWDQATQRAQRDGWPFPDVLRRLLEDYAAGRTSPSGTPPEDPIVMHYSPLIGNAFDRLATAIDWDALTDRERGQRLRQVILGEDAATGRARCTSDADFTLIAKRLAQARRR